MRLNDIPFKAPFNSALYLYVEVLKCSGVPSQQVRRVLGEEADAEQTLHPLEIGSVHHLREYNSTSWITNYIFGINHTYHSISFHR